MNWAHLHLALNHLPVLGTLFVLLLFTVALIRRNREFQRISLWAFVLVTALTFPIKYTGEEAFEMVMAQDGFPDEPIEAHEKAADQATTGVFVLGVLAAVGLFLSRKQRPLPAWVSGLVLVAGLGTFLLMARAANLGGEIRHPEIKRGFKFPEAEK